MLLENYYLDNLIFNGDFLFWRYGTTSFTATSSVQYVSDMWWATESTDGTMTIIQDTNVPTITQTGRYIPYSLKLTCTVADASLTTTQASFFTTSIEGYNFRYAVGKYYTLSFWVRSSKTGIYCVSFRNSTSADRTYVVEYTINTADTWEKKFISVPFNYSGGTWNYTNSAGLLINWCLGSGPTYQTTSNIWQNGNYLATSNQVNWLDSNSSRTFYITGVEFKEGSGEIPWIARPYTVEDMLVQRYHPYFGSTDTADALASGVCRSTTTATLFIKFVSPTRISITGLTVSNVAHFSLTNASGGAITSTNATFNVVSLTYGEIAFTVASGLVEASGTTCYFNNTSAFARFTGAQL